VSCELILVSILVKYAGYAGSIYIVPSLEAPRLGRQPKQAVVKKISYIRRLMGHESAGGVAQGPLIFIG
jgi:hypothetical protein